MEFPPLRWAVEGIIPEGTGIAAGSPKVGKSWMVADIALACTVGGKALGGCAVDARPVLYLALEDGEKRLRNRLRQLMDGQPIPPAINLHVDIPNAITTAEGFFSDHANDAPLVILDTLGKVTPASATYSYSVDYQTITNFMEMQKTAPGSTLLIVHHTRQADASDFIDKVSGTSGIAGAADFVMVVSRKRHASTGLLSVTGRDVPEYEYQLRAVTLAEGGIQWRLDETARQQAGEFAEGQRFSEQTNAVLAFVRDRQGEVTPAEIADGLGIDAKQASNVCGRLVARGLLVKAGRGTYRTPGESGGSDESAGQTGKSIHHLGSGDEKQFTTENRSDEKETMHDQVIHHFHHNPTHTPPEPGENHSGTIEDRAKMDSTGSEGVRLRICKTPYCGKPASSRDLCKHCLALEDEYTAPKTETPSIDNLITNSALRADGIKI